jgi:hypothetical protein
MVSGTFVRFQLAPVIDFPNTLSGVGEIDITLSVHENARAGMPECGPENLNEYQNKE